MRMRAAALCLAIGLLAPRAEAQSEPGAVKPADTVRVWSRPNDWKNKRGVVTRADADSIAFLAPSGFRKLPHEFSAQLDAVERIDVLDGRSRSGWRVLRQTLLGGAIGSVGGGLLGVGVGTVLFKSSSDGDNGEHMDSRALAQFIFGAVGFYVGGSIGLIGGAIDGFGAKERWRRIK